MKTVGYAIVGTGYFGAELGRIMKEQEGARIVAVLDPENGQTIAEELDCDVETDLDTLYSRKMLKQLLLPHRITYIKSRSSKQQNMA